MKRIFFGLTFLIMLLICGSVFAYDDSKPQLYVEKVGEGSYASGRDGIQSFASTQDIILRTGGKNISDNVSVDVYEADMDDVLNYLIYRDEGDQINTTVSTGNMKHIVTMNTYRSDEFTLPVEGTGIWLIHTHVDNIEIFVYVIRSRYGTVVKEEKEGLLFWVQDFEDKCRVADAKITIYSLRDKMKKRVETKTDHDGIAHTNTSAKYDVVVVEDGNDGSLIPLNLEYLNIGYKRDSNKYPAQQKRERNFIFTDRPLYKPGDVVYFKMIARNDSDYLYEIAQGKRTAEISTGWGDNKKVIASSTYEMDSYGTIAGELQLPKDLKTGEYYRLAITSEQEREDDWFYGWNSDSVQIQIEHYRKPQYEVGVSVDNHEYINGENITFDIEGKYFSGEALADVQVEYKVRESKFWEPLYENDLSSNINEHRYGYRHGNDVTKGTATLSKDGKTTVSVPTTISDGMTKIYTIEITYTPKTGEPIIDQENVLVYAGDFGIYRTNYQHSFHINEDVAVELQLHGNQDGANLSNQNLDITGKNVWWEVKDINKRYLEYERREKELPTNTIVTNNEGMAVFHFAPRDTGSHIFTVSGKDNIGNIIKKEFHIWVTDCNRFTSERGNGISIVLDKDEYEPDEIVRVSISSKISDRDVLLDIERDFVHRFQVVHIENTEIIEIPLEDADIPNMRIRADSFADNRLDTAGDEVKISSQSKNLNIIVNTDKESYAPGDTVKVDVVTKDYEGHAQKADVALWAVDKALFELVPQSNHNIHSRYWKQRYGHTNSSNSLRGIWINMAESGGCFLQGTQVLMDNGVTKNIEDIREGESVLTFDNEQKNLVSARVTKTHNAISQGYFIINDTLRVTGNHIVWVNNTWKSVAEIRIGDVMRNKNYQEIIIDKIVWQGTEERVYNLIIDESHTYIADDYFVHNGKDGGMRTLFKDVAYWNPHVRTGNDGKAQVSFKLPDDLTTWVISAIGATKETIVGNSTKEIKVTKAVIIRPQLPNILRKGDRATLVALAQNNTFEDRVFIANLTLDKGAVDGAEQEINIPAGKSKVVQWVVSPEYADEEIEFTFSLTARDDETINDIVRKNVSIERFGYWETNSSVHTGTELHKVQIDNDARNEKTTIELTIASTMLSSLTSATDYLLQYPYGCMEQTTSAFMPAVLAKENPQFFAEALEGKNIDAIIDTGVTRLTDKQNTDGGWSWWGGESDIFLSAYVAEYLLRAQTVGASVNKNMLDRVKEYFGSNKALKDDEKNIIIAYGQSLFDGNNNNSEIKTTIELSSDLVAMAVIANVRNGHINKATNGYDVLVSQLQRNGNTAYYSAGAEERFGSIDASSGIALRALLVAEKDTKLVSSIVRHFLTARKKEYWTSTFATAQVLEGFAIYAQYEQEKSQNYIANIFVDDTLLTTKTFNSNNTIENISIPTEMIKENGSNISIKTIQQAVVLYSTLLTKQYHTSNASKPISRTISLERSYHNEKGKNYSIGIGDIVVVDFVVDGLKKGNRYFMIEDQLPAGMVPLNEHLDNVSRDDVSDNKYNYVQKEYTKNGVILSDRYVNKDGKQYYRYKARVVSGGDYNVPPAQAMPMYLPEVYAHSGSQMMHIDNESQIVAIDGSKKDDTDKNGILSNWSLKNIIISINIFLTIATLILIVIFYKKNGTSMH